MIKAVDQADFELVLPLIKAYQDFYQCAPIDDKINHAHFSQFGPNSDKGCIFLYMEDGAAVGFSTVYFTFSSTLPGKVGVMNDLFITEKCRGKGIGRQLIEHSLIYAQSRGALRMQWLTSMSNEVAQRLYDSLNAKKSDWHFYAYTGS